METEQAKKLSKARKVLSDLAGTVTTEEDVEFVGKTFVFPSTFAGRPRAGVKWLAEWCDEQEARSLFVREFPYRPWDGAVATHRVLKRLCGIIKHQGATLSVPTGVNQKEDVLWGQFEVPGQLDGWVFHLKAMDSEKHGRIFCVSVEAPKLDRKDVTVVFDMIQHELEGEHGSIYRGKAFDGAEMPEFLDLSSVDPDKVVYTKEVQAHLESNIWMFLRHPDKIATKGISLKRSILLEGPFGTGKTLAAFLTAQIAVENGWTFIYCRPGKDNMEDVFSTAELYQPAVVFIEDVDGATEGTNVNNSAAGRKVSKLLEMFDGIKTKGARIISVLTTNNPELIQPGMLRAGRTNTIHIGEYDVDAIHRLADVVFRPEQLAPDIDWGTVAVSMEGMMPAFVREAFDRANLYNMAANQGEEGVLVTEDFVHAAESLRGQLGLMHRAGNREEDHHLEERFQELVRTGFTDHMAELAEQIRERIQDTL